MKRRTVHLLFALCGSACASLAAHEGHHWQQAKQLELAISRIPASLSAEDSPPAVGIDTPAVQLAVANAYSAGRALDTAERLYSELIDTGQTSLLRQAARLNLANAYLREAIRLGPDTARSRSLIELAKQRYRDLLAAEPDHWAAKYNLEHALLLAPEAASSTPPDMDPAKRVRVIVPDFEPRDLP